ncbi:hypothetical protein Lal_00013357 [Lupinus albus]|nr:hypothetical protein Lal_00013357 [Lupinus albus]
MASSSRTKKPRINVSQSEQGTSSSKSNPLNLTRLLANDEQRKMIMQQMWQVRGSQSPLPYAICITKILEHFGVSLDGETKVAHNLRESKIDVEGVHKIRFSIDPIDRRTYKLRTDRPTDPIDSHELSIHVLEN